MNANNVMAVNASPQGKTATTAKATATRGRSAKGEQKGAFENELNKVRQKDQEVQPKDVQEVAKEVTEENITVKQDQKPSDEEGNKEEPKAAANNEAEKADGTTKSSNEQKDAKIENTAIMTAPTENADENEDWVESLNLNVLAATNGFLTVPSAPADDQAEVNLFSIMPQDKAASQKSDQMLAMLSGHSFVEEETAINENMLLPKEGKLPFPQSFLNLRQNLTAEQTPQEMQPVDLTANFAEAEDAPPVVDNRQNVPNVPNVQNVQNINIKDEVLTARETVPNEGRTVGDAAMRMPSQAALKSISEQSNTANMAAINAASAKGSVQPPPTNLQNTPPVPTQNSSNDVLAGAPISIENTSNNPFNDLAQMFGHGRDFGQERQNFENNSETAQFAVQQATTEPEREFVSQVAQNSQGEAASGQTSATVPTAGHAETAQQPAAATQSTDNPDATNNTNNVRDNFNIREQIVEQARLIRSTENTQMVIRLRPEHLGELTLRVSVAANGALSASFHTPNAEVRAILENSLVQLRQELNNQGLKVEDVEVYAGLADGQLPNGQGQQAWQQGQGQNNAARNIRADMETFEETAAGIAPGASADELTDSVDYRI